MQIRPPENQLNDLSKRVQALPGDALITAGACFPDAEQLQKVFSPIEFVDLCVGIDAAVLHGKLHFPGGYPPSRHNPLGQMLLQEGILRAYDLGEPEARGNPEKEMERFFNPRRPPYAEYITRHPRLRHLTLQIRLMNDHIRAEFLASPSYKDNEWSRWFLYELNWVHIDDLMIGAVLEDWFELPLIVSPSYLPLYLELPDVIAERKAFRRLYRLLWETYADFKDILLALRQEVERDEIVAIPPIALEALSLSKDMAELPDVVMGLREKYQPVRVLFTEMEETLRSQEVALKEKLKTKATIRKAISRLFEPQEIDEIHVWTSWARHLNQSGDMFDLIKDADPDHINWTKVIGFLIEKADAAYWRFRLRPLYSTKSRYIQASIATMRDAVKRHFGHHLTNSDAESVSSYFESAKELQQPPSLGDGGHPHVADED